MKIDTEFDCTNIDAFASTRIAHRKTDSNEDTERVWFETTHGDRQSTAIAHDETDCNEETEYVWFWATKLMMEHSKRFVARAARLLPNYHYFCYT
jgi:hypothetical protein